jgi:hypothetical protein
VSGTYSGPPGEYIIIDIYANKSADESGFGEGQFLIHSFGVSIGSTGRATFSETFSTGRTSIFGSPLGTVYTSQAQTNSLEFGAQHLHRRGIFALYCKEHGISRGNSQRAFDPNAHTESFQ